jgi:hypothetical protein
MKALGFVVATALAVALSLSAAEARGMATQVRRTVSCATDQGALQIVAFATNPAVGTPGVGAAAAGISTGDPNVPASLLAVDTRYKHYKLSGSCRSATKRVVLTHRGLTSAGTVHAGDRQSPTVYCAATRRVLMRFLLGFNAAGKPVSATIEVVTQPKRNRKSKRIGFVQWSPKRSVTYYSSACTSQQ